MRYVITNFLEMNFFFPITQIIDCNSFNKQEQNGIFDSLEDLHFSKKCGNQFFSSAIQISTLFVKCNEMKFTKNDVFFIKRL